MTERSASLHHLIEIKFGLVFITGFSLGLAIGVLVANFAGLGDKRAAVKPDDVAQNGQVVATPAKVELNDNSSGPSTSAAQDQIEYITTLRSSPMVKGMNMGQLNILISLMPCLPKPLKGKELALAQIEYIRSIRTNPEFKGVSFGQLEYYLRPTACTQ